MRSIRQGMSRIGLTLTRDPSVHDVDGIQVIHSRERPASKQYSLSPIADQRSESGNQRAHNELGCGREKECVGSNDSGHVTHSLRHDVSHHCDESIAKSFIVVLPL